jgi:hypothetical protein
MVLETSVSYRHLARLIAREDFVEFSRRESSVAPDHTETEECYWKLLSTLLSTYQFKTNFRASEIRTRILLQLFKQFYCESD